MRRREFEIQYSLFSIHDSKKYQISNKPDSKQVRRLLLRQLPDRNDTSTRSGQAPSAEFIPRKNEELSEMAEG